MSVQQYNIYPILTPARLVSTSNVAGTYFNGLTNNGVGATLTIAASSLTVDSVVAAVGDRILLAAQTSANQNGMYVVTSIGTTVILQRSADMQSIEQLRAGFFMSVGAGSVNAGNAYSIVEPLPAVFGINNLTLNAEPASGVVTFSGGPSVANNIPVFADTAGNLKPQTATATLGFGLTISTGNLAVSAGNITAGSSGNAGTVGSFPAAATSGELLLAAVTNSAGNFNTTISNAASVAQSQVISIPDSGSATANFVLSKSLAATQHITTGSLAIDAGTLISGIATGGQVGTLQLFPTTASKGSLSWQATANTGNTATIFTTAAYGQASTITYPDPAQAAANGVLAPNALVSGNLVSASGTAGLIQDSGIVAANIQLNTVTVTMNQAAVQGAFATPVQIVAAPGAGKTIIPVEMSLYTNFQTSAFAGGGVAICQYNNTIHGAGTNALAATIPAAEITAAASQIYNLGATSATVLTGVTNQGIFFSNATGAFTGGSASSTIVVTLSYYVITATV